MKLKSLSFSVALGLLSAVATTASAQIPADTLRVVEYVAPSHAFGHRGQVLLGGTTALNISGTYQQGPNKVRGPGLSFSPTASAFVAKHIALGLTGTVNGQYVREAKKTEWSLTVGPLVTVAVPLSDRVSFLPSVAPVYTRAGGANQASLQMNVDFAVHASNHMMVTFGPYVNQDMYSSNKDGGRDTVFGAKAGLLGWL